MEVTKKVEPQTVVVPPIQPIQAQPKPMPPTEAQKPAEHLPKPKA